MKKLLTGWTLALLGSALLLGISGCTKQAGSLSPAAPVMNVGASGNRTLPKITGGTGFTNVSTTAEVVFDQPMDPASFNAATVQLYTLDPSGVTETLYTNYTLAYDAAGKTLRFIPGGGAWANNQRYHAVYTTGIQSLTGRPLDGNGNGIAEGDEFDAFQDYDTCGSPAASPVYIQTTGGVQVGSASLAYNGVSQAVTLTSPNYLSINGSYTYVTLTTTFTLAGANADPNFSFDATTFYAGAAALHPNVSFADAGGTPITPVLVSVTSTVLANDTLTIVANLAPSSKYLFKLKGGLAGIRSSSASHLWLRRGHYFNGNLAVVPGSENHTGVEASDDSPLTVIQTRNAENNAMTQVRITGDSYDSTHRRFAMTFTVTGGTATLDPATITPANFMLSDEGYSGYACAPSMLLLDNATTPNPVVYVYIPMRFVDYGIGDAHTLTVLVSKEVRSGDGVKLDQNLDGVPGTSADNYLSTGASVYNY